MVGIPIDQVWVAERFRGKVGNLSSLKGSIESVGMLQPIVVRADMGIVIGVRRLEACRELGWVEIEATVVSDWEADRLEQAEIEENTIREDFQLSDLVGIARYLEGKAQEEAKARQGARTDLGEEHSGKLPESERGDSRDLVVAGLPISATSMRKARAVVEAHEEDIEKYGWAQDEMDRTGKIDNVYKRLMDLKYREEIEANPPVYPEGKYGILLVDPPWQYDFAASSTRAIENQYATMSLEELGELPVGDWCLDDGVLYMWVTAPKGKDAHWLLEQWGFEYKTNIVWVKDRIGMGYYARNQHELVYIATRGKPRVPDAPSRQSSVFDGERMKHSEKPRLHGMLSEQYPQVPKLEMFARQVARPRDDDWSFWGTLENG